MGYKNRAVLQRLNVMVLITILLVSSIRISGQVTENTTVESLVDTPQPSYMIYYGALDAEIIEQAKQYDIMIVHHKI